MTQEQELIQFFKVYCKFLSTDLFLSLRPAKNPLNNNMGGRNIVLLYKFFEVFFNIYLKEYDLKIRTNNLLLLNDAILEYIDTSEDADGLLKGLKCEQIIDNSENEVFQIFEKENYQLLNNFYEIVLLFKCHITEYSQITRLFSSSTSEPILGQGLIEFHNAMSHLTFVAREKKNTNGNVDKAMSHIYRGIVDNIKSIIKNLDLDVIQKAMLVNIRTKEFNSLGCSITVDKLDVENTNTKVDIVEQYTKLLLSLLTKFPSNKLYLKDKISYKELNARLINNRQKKKKRNY